MASTKIPEEKIEELKAAVDIVDVVSDYVQLKKQGRNYFGLCPFHGENTPSFSVSKEKQIFHCFGCGTGGNVFTFLMEIESIPFQKAAEILAAKGNVELEIQHTGELREHVLPPEQAQMIDAHELLAKFYHHLLLNTNEGMEALEYLKQRGFTAESIQKFQIGYSLPEWDFAVKFLDKRKFPISVMVDAGLIGRRDSDGAYFDRFRNRIMFPLHNDRGDIVAFSARAITNEDQPKYLNTTDTKIFSKSSLLYNYSSARSHIRKLGYSVLFEGFADVISADSAGVKNGVAAMGTALTEKHARLLKRLADSIVLCFDSDDAGIEAAYRAGTLLDQYKFEIKVAMMPPGLDPDDYIQKFGAEKFGKDVIGNPQTWTEFKLYHLRKGKNLNNEGIKLEYIEKALLEISRLGNALERELYIQQLADEFSLPIETLKQQQMQLGDQFKSRPKLHKQHEQTYQFSPKLPNAHVVAEQRLIAMMLREEELVYKVMDMLKEAVFNIDEHQAIFTYLIGYYEEGHRPDTSLFLNYLPDNRLRKIVTEIEMQNFNIDYSEKELRDYVCHVLNYPKLLMIKEKQAEQKAAERKNDFIKALDIAKEIVDLRKSIKTSI